MAVTITDMPSLGLQRFDKAECLYTLRMMERKVVAKLLECKQEYMDKKIDELSRQLQEEKQNTRREKLAVARLQRELSKAKTETPSRETLMKDLMKERELRLEAEKRLTEMTTESETCKTRLETLQTEFEKMEEAVKNMLQYKTKIEQLKMEKSNVILAYENNLQKFRTHINNLEKNNSSLMNEFQNREALVNQEETRKEKSLLVERLRALEAENSALVLENESQREQYERCLDEVANQVVQALLMQKDLRAECIKLQNRVFDLEQQNKLLNMMFERERQRQSTRELSMQTYPTKHSRGKGVSGETPNQTTNEDSSISVVTTPTTSNTATQALYRSQGAPGSAQSSPSIQKRNNKPTNKSGGARPLIRKEGGNSPDYAGLSSESLHSTHSNQANYAYPSVPTMQLGWSPTSKHKAFANGDLYHSQSEFSSQRHVHSLDRYTTGFHGGYMKETSAMIDMFAHYGRPDRLYPQFNGVQQELAEERMYQASAQKNCYQGGNGKIPAYDEIGMSSEMPPKLRETFRQFHVESLQTEHMIGMQPLAYHQFAKTEKPNEFTNNRRDANPTKPVFDPVASRNGLIVTDKYHLPYKHAPYETAQSVMKELNDATANVKSFDSLVASDVKHSKRSGDRGTLETMPRLETSSPQGSLDSGGTDESEGAAPGKGLLDSSFSLNSLESSDDDDGGGQEMYQIPTLSGERNEIFRTTGETNYDRSPSQARIASQIDASKGTEIKEINTSLTSLGKIVNDLGGVKGESAELARANDGMNNNSNLNKLSTYTSPWRKDPRAALNISLDVPTNESSGQSAFVQYTSVTRNHHTSYKPETSKLNSVVADEDKSVSSCSDNLNCPSIVQVPAEASSSQHQIPDNSIPEKITSAIQSGITSSSPKQPEDHAAKEKEPSGVENGSSVRDKELGKEHSQSVIDGEQKAKTEKKVFKRQSPVEDSSFPQPVRLLEEESDDSLYHSSINKELVELMKRRTSEERSSEGKGQNVMQPNCKTTTSGNCVKIVDGIRTTDGVQNMQKCSPQVPVKYTNGSPALWYANTKPELIKQSSLNETYREGREDGLCEEERQHLYRRLSAENRVPSFISPEKLNAMKQENASVSSVSSSPVMNPDDRPIRPYYAAQELEKKCAGSGELSAKGKAVEVAKCGATSHCKGKAVAVENSCGHSEKCSSEKVKSKDQNCCVDGAGCPSPIVPGQSKSRIESSVGKPAGMPHTSVVEVSWTRPREGAAHIAWASGRAQSESSLFNKPSQKSTFQKTNTNVQGTQIGESKFASSSASVREVEILTAQSKDLTLLNLSPRFVLKSAPLRRSPCQILNNGIMEDESEAPEESKHPKSSASALLNAEKSKTSGSVESLNSLNSVDSVGSAAASLKSSISRKSATPLSEFLSDSEEEEDRPLVNFVDVLQSWTQSSTLPDADHTKTEKETIQNVPSGLKADNDSQCDPGNHANKRPDGEESNFEDLLKEKQLLQCPVPKMASSPEPRNGQAGKEHIVGDATKMPDLSPVVDAASADKNGKALFAQEDSSADPSEMKDLGTEKFSQNDPKVVKENFNATSAKIEEIRKTNVPDGERTTMDDCAVLTRPTTLFIPAAAKATTLRPYDYKMILKDEKDRQQNHVQLYRRPVPNFGPPGVYHQRTSNSAIAWQHRPAALQITSTGGHRQQISAPINAHGGRPQKQLKKNEPRPVCLRSVYSENQNSRHQMGAVSTSHFAMKNDDVPFIDDSSSGQDSDTVKTPEDFTRMETIPKHCSDGRQRVNANTKAESSHSVDKCKRNGVTADSVQNANGDVSRHPPRTDRPTQGTRAVDNVIHVQRVEIYPSRPSKRTDTPGDRHHGRTTDMISSRQSDQLAHRGSDRDSPRWTHTSSDRHPQRKPDIISDKHLQNTVATTDRHSQTNCSDRHPHNTTSVDTNTKRIQSLDRHTPKTENKVGVHIKTVESTNERHPHRTHPAAKQCVSPKSKTDSDVAAPSPNGVLSHSEKKQEFYNPIVAQKTDLCQGPNQEHCQTPYEPSLVDIRIESKASQAPIISADLMEDFEGSDLYDSDDIESAGEDSAQLDAHERANLLDSFFESDSDDSCGDSDDTDHSHPGEDAFLRLLGNRRQVLRYSESNRVSILDFKIQELYTRYDDKEREAMACFDFLEELVDELDVDTIESNDNPVMDTNQNSQTDIIPGGGVKLESDTDDEGMQRERHSEGSSSPERLSLSDSLYDSYSSSGHSLSSIH
ncbi:uncharacterized protein [Ptychodera flava]|uniref:uncharacterized protein isoform X2 n=1 Tax=Ptychodera flava TaxID=63121 RepID=UPI00396A08B0